MRPHPLRLLIAGYVIAAGAAVVVHAAAGVLLGALLTFWLGGAVAVVALATLPGVSRRFRLPAEDDLEAELRRWEEDRRSEAEAAATSRPEDRTVAG